MRIRTKLNRLNKDLLAEAIAVGEYKEKTSAILAPLDWHTRIQFDNMLLA